jgi:large subunit ribosomal protein L29
MLKANEIRQKGRAELQQLILDLRREQFNLRMQRGSGQQVKTHRVRELRREIARIKTVMNEAVGGSAQ